MKKSGFLVTVLIQLFSVSVIFADDIPQNTYFFPAETEERAADNISDSETEDDMHIAFFNADDGQLDEQSYYEDTQDDFSFFYYLDSGYHNSSVNWSVSSPSGSPDILTEVKWKNLSLVGFDAGFTISMPYNLIFKADVGYAWTVSGNSNQISYLRDGRRNPFSSINNDSDEGYARHGSLALGYALNFGSITDDSVAFNFTPLAGYSWQKVSLKADQGREQISDFIQSDLDTLKQRNSYSANWNGPWLGADITLSAFQHHQIFTSFQHHWADYKAKGHWRQSPQLQQPKSFEHKTDATGIIASAGYRYITDDLLGVSVSVDYQNWESESGKETLFTRNNEKFESRFNEVERESFGINIGLNMNF